MTDGPPFDDPLVVAGVAAPYGIRDLVVHIPLDVEPAAVAEAERAAGTLSGVLNPGELIFILTDSAVLDAVLTVLRDRDIPHYYEKSIVWIRPDGSTWELDRPRYKTTRQEDSL